MELRNEHQHLIHEVQAQLQLHPSRVRPEDCGRISSIISRLKVRGAAGGSVGGGAGGVRPRPAPSQP